MTSRKTLKCLLTSPEKKLWKNFFLQILSTQITNIGSDCFQRPTLTTGANRVFCAGIILQGKLNPVCTYTFSIINQDIKKIRTQVQLIRKNVYSNLQIRKKLLFRLLKYVVQSRFHWISCSRLLGTLISLREKLYLEHSKNRFSFFRFNL